MAPRDIDHTSLGEIFEHSRLSRRQLLKRSVIFGLSVPAVASLLAACGDDDDDEPEATAPPSAPDPTSAPEEEDEETPEAEVEETPEDEDEETPEAAAEETPEDEDEETPAAEAPVGEGVRGGKPHHVCPLDVGWHEDRRYFVACYDSWRK